MHDPVVVDTYPLSPLQQGMLFHHLEGSNLGVDIEQMVGELSEAIDVDALQAAWQHVVDRHAVLRTSFQWVGVERPMQQVVDHVEVHLAEHDWREVEPDEQSHRFERFMVSDRLAGFDLSAPAMWRLSLFRLTDSHSRFVFTYHHSLLDISVVWVVQEAFQQYDAARAGKSLALAERRPYKDHIVWLDEHLESNRDAAQAYFRELLDGFEEPTRLTALQRATPPEDDNGIYGAHRFELPPELSSKLHKLGADTATSLPAVIEGAWALLIASFSGSADVVFGSTRGCRRSGLPGSETTVGLFINTPPVRVRIDPNQTVADFLEAVRRQQIDKRAYEHTPLTDIQAGLADRAAATFETIVVINELHQGTRIKQGGAEFANREFDLHDQTNFPLTLLAYTDPQIKMKLSYNRQRFDLAAMQRVESLLSEILAALVGPPETPLVDLPRVSRAELAVLRAWNSTNRAYDASATIGHLFEAQVDRTPDAVAVAFRDERITYRELDRRANEVAEQLQQLGVGPDQMVGVFIERSIEMVAGLLGVLKAGAAYVPMDPTYPTGRVGMMLEDSSATVVLTHSRLRSSLPGAVQHVIELDRLGGGSDHRVAVPTFHSGHLAYVIFTSGSTGRPKGVMIEHRNVANFLVAMDDQLGFETHSSPGVWLGVTSISFDISVLELFWTLTRGFLLVLQEDDARLTDGSPSTAQSSTRRAMDFSLFYFASDSAADNQTGSNRYRLLIDGAKFADQHGFAAVWTPERHFHEFGGIYPNAALTSAAVAMVTERISIRAGSVVLPLHNPIRAAEDWSVVDNLSNGRVGLSFASGWHANDFVLAPDNFVNRRALMAEGIATITSLWRGESIVATNGEGRDVSVKLYPPPIQAAPPTWITAGGSPETFAMAGQMGANILTNLLVMSADDLVKNVAAYRTAYQAGGHAGNGHVSVMLHTFVGADAQSVRNIVREPFLEYLRTSTDLINKMQWEQTSFAKGDTNKPVGGSTSGVDLADLSAEDTAAIMDHAFDRYFDSAGLFGTPESCLATIDRLSALGVDEVACLIDFGVAEDEVLASLTHLDRLRQLCETSADATNNSSARFTDDDNYGMAAQIARHSVTHLQCTPSLAAVLAADPDGLAAIATLDKLLLGGEALPAALVDRIRPAMRGQLLNMYGPTETTIWSTVSPIQRAGDPITIGRPIANTQVYIVDAHRQANPIGAAGELLIGGDGVVRGYLDRPELTADKFVNLPGVDGRVYRTGDLARMLPNGEIEFSGRLDHQVKIRGYRIELGEIEAAIGRFPDTFETVVVARTDTPGEPRLVAYVVPNVADGGAATAAGSATAAWGTIWDETYRTSEVVDPTFNIAGWNDSYTGEPIPADQMRQWVELTVERILDRAPRRVLEIGCGTGLLLFRIAPHVTSYLGVDLAQSAIDRIADICPGLGLDNVTLACGQAQQIESLVASTAGADQRFDMIVLNSVAQYFPDAEFLVSVITQAMRLLEPGGQLFLGDLRSKQHLSHFAAAVELSRAPANMLRSDLAARAHQRADADEELVVDPALFLALQRAVPELADVRISLKPGSYDNEMTRFRFDAILTREGGHTSPAHPDQVVSMDGTSVSLDDIRRALHAGPAVLRVVGVRNDRLVRETALERLLTEPSGPSSVAELRSALGAVTSGIHPHDLRDIHPNYQVNLEWSATGTDRFDAVLRSRVVPSDTPTPFVQSSLPWSSYTNRPAVKELKNLVPDLRSHLRATLPDYMVPTAFVVLDALPRTPNGKIDRNALPAPDRSRVEGTTAVAADTDIERTIAAVWQDMLALDAVGVETNLFDLGANSLMMVQANTRLREALSRPVSLVEMFRFPTVRSLAEHLDGDSGQVAEVMQSSADRGQARKDAMQRRREARQNSRPDRGR